MNFETGDINILYSMINMKLRDEFSDLDDLVNFYSADKVKLIERLEKNGYFYHPEDNQFRRV